MLLLFPNYRWCSYDRHFVTFVGVVLYYNDINFILELQFHGMVVSSRFPHNHPCLRYTSSYNDLQLLVRKKQKDSQGIKDSDGTFGPTELFPIYVVYGLCAEHAGRLGYSRFRRNQNWHQHGW